MSYVQYDRFANNPKPKGANVENKKSRVRVDFKGKMLRTQLFKGLWGAALSKF
jgi:hypothetical protein